MNNKTWLRVFTILLMALITGSFILPIVQAGPMDDFAEPFQTAFNFIIDIFKLDFLDNTAEAYGALVRFCLWLITFAIVYEILSKFQYFSPKTSKIIGFCFATISAVFIPVNILLAIGGIWGAFMIMIFTGAIVYIGWRLAQWIKNTGGEGTPGAKWVFAVIMLVLIYIVYILQFALTEERGFEFMFLGFNVFRFYGWITILFLVGLLISGMFFSGVVAGAVGANLLNNMATPKEAKAKRETEKDEKKGAKAALDADRRLKDFEKAEDIAKELIRVEETINKEMLNIDSEALIVLQRLGQYIDAIGQLAEQLIKIGGPETQQKYQQYVVAAIAAADQLLAAVGKEDKLAHQEAKRIKEKINITRGERRKTLRKVKTKLGTFKSSITRAERATKGTKYKTLKGNVAKAQDYRKRAQTVELEMVKLTRLLERIEKKENKIIKDAIKDIHDEVKKIEHLKDALQELQRKPEPGKIHELKTEVGEIHGLIAKRIQDYKELLQKEGQEGEIHLREEQFLQSCRSYIQIIETQLIMMGKETKKIPDEEMPKE